MKTPKYAELPYNTCTNTCKEKYEVHIVVEFENKQKSYKDNGKTLTIDLSQIHPMALDVNSGPFVAELNGLLVISIVRDRPKVKSVRKVVI